MKVWMMVGAVLFSGCMALPASAADDGKKKEDMKADEAEAAGLCPVCKGESKPVYHYEYKDKTYHFKTRQCCKDFIADPTKFGAVGKDWKPAPDPKASEKKPDDKKTDDKKSTK